mmetsp:Transcript_5645/g.18621  ORF Transcript_5645/g.18621 Transcript_5645/m.18621 type:complete len:279 (-) Transcript_5645:316-1152(-)
MVTTITFSASIPALTHSVPASALTHCVVCGVLMPFASTFAAICAEKPFAPWPMRPANGVCSCPPRIAAISGTSSAKRASSGSVWCVRAIIASTSFRNALAAARAKGTHSANTTPLGFFALDNGVEVVHSPNSPIFTPPSSTTMDRGRRSMNLPAASSSTSGCGTPIGTPSPDALAIALRVATSDVFSSPSGHAKTFVLITAQRNSPSRAPRISMEWSNSWFPRHACVTGIAFIALTAAAPKSSDESNDGDRKSPFKVHSQTSPGSTLSWMKHFNALRF